jgi:hypothetical protein
VSANCIVRNVGWAIKNEMLVIKGSIAISVIILLGVLIGLSKYGINLRSVFLGPAEGASEPSRGIIALEGAVVAVSLLFGAIFLAGVIILAKKRIASQPAATKEEAAPKPPAETPKAE